MSSTNTISSDQQIRLLYEQILIAWNQQDAPAMAAYFEEDGNLVGYDGSQADSRAAIEDHLQPIFADHPTATYVAKVREIRMLSSKVGILRAVVGMIPPGSDNVNPAGKTLYRRWWQSRMRMGGGPLSFRAHLLPGTAADKTVRL